MGSLLSAISGQFAKLILLGTFFPVVVVSALNLILVVPLLPDAASFPIHLDRIVIGDDKWQAVVLSFVVVVLTGLLYDLNNPIIKLYEGYPWRNSFVGRALVHFAKKRLKKATQLFDDGYELREAAAAPEFALIRGDLASLHTDLGVYLNSELPDREDLVLPTRLGNVISSFERYATQAYGMDAIILWPRLVSKIDAGFASTIDEAKTTFDFMLNMSFLCGLTALGILLVAIVVPFPLQWTTWEPLGTRLLLFSLLSLIFYYLAVNRAASWGMQVKAAFDLYRLNLLEALGYKQKPLSYQEERQIWTAISAELTYANDRKDPLPYEDTQTRVIAFPPAMVVGVERKYVPANKADHAWVVLTLSNADPNHEVKFLTVVDTLPEGFEYVQESASVEPEIAGLRITQLTPLSFLLGEIQAGAALEVRYLIKTGAAWSPKAG